MKSIVRTRNILIILFVTFSAVSIPSADLIVDNIELLVDKCVNVENPVLIECEVMGYIRLIGLKGLSEDSEYFDSGLEFVKERIEGKEVMLDIDHINPHTEEGYIRAVVYYDKSGKWWNLNVEMVEEGITRVVPVLNSHVDPKAWLTEEKRARSERRGIWENFKPGEFFEE